MRISFLSASAITAAAAAADVAATLASVPAVVAATHAGTPTHTVAPDTSRSFGVWEGWGTSLCWWANVLGDGPQASDIATLLFSTRANVTVGGGGAALADLPALGLNIARYNAGGSSTAPDEKGEHMSLSKNMRAGGEVRGFWLDWGSADPDNATCWDWSADAAQRAMLLQARDAVRADGDGGTPFVAELFSNSPMWWMLANHNPSGGRVGTADNLQPWNQGDHAVYLATVAARAATHWNVTFSSVDAFNEPASGWWTATGSQEGCHFDPATQAAVVPLLRAELDGRALQHVRVAASDENSYDLALSTWRAFPVASQKAVSQINVHGYQEGSGDRAGLYAAAQQAGVVLRNSEYGDGDGSGLGLAANLNLDFAQLHPTAWVYWQAFDGGGWGLVQGDNDRASISAPNPKYFVLAQYSRHIRPGDTIVAGGDGGHTVAATSARAGGTIVLVRLNQGAAQSIKFDLSGLGVAPGAAVPRWCTQPDDKEGERYARHDDTTVGADGSFIAKFGKNTICTFEVPMKMKTSASHSH